MTGPPENHRRPQATAGDTAGRAVSRRHRQKTCRLAAAAAGKMYFTDVS